MTSDEYERVTKELMETIVEQVEGVRADRVGHGLRNRLKGQSEYPHQIDVSVEGAHDLLLVECKMWKAPVKVPAFLAFLGRIVDIRPTQPSLKMHASIVTTKGFQRGVRQLADYYQIQLDKVSSPAEFAMKYKQLFAVGVQDDLNRWADSAQTQLD
jgi:hypothetical protein